MLIPQNKLRSRSILSQTSAYEPIQILTFTLTTALLALCLQVLTLRFCSRRLKRQTLALNDVLSIISLLLLISFYTLIAYGLTTGMGRTASSLSNARAQQPHLLKLMVPLPILWSSINTCVKVSMLHLYLRLFPQQRLKWVCWTLMALSTALWAVTLIFPFVNCQPFSYTWHRINNSAGGHCLDNQGGTLPFGVSNLILDIAVIVLPLPYLYTLKLKRAKKVALMGIFALGFVISIISAVRIWTVVGTGQKDFSYGAAEIALWSFLETGLSVVNCCLPVIQPALLAVINRVATMTRGREKGDESLPTHKFITLTFDSEEDVSGSRSSTGQRDLEVGRAAEDQACKGGEKVRCAGDGNCNQATDGCGRDEDVLPKCRVVELDEELILPPRRKNLMWYLYG